MARRAFHIGLARDRARTAAGTRIRPFGDGRGDEEVTLTVTRRVLAVLVTVGVVARTVPTFAGADLLWWDGSGALLDWDGRDE